MSNPTRAAGAVETDQTPRDQPLPWRTLILVLGDVIAFLVFAGIGRSNHGELSGFNAPIYLVGTVLPFAFAWFVISPFLGAFRRETTVTLHTMLAHTELAWLCAWPLAMLIRFIADRIRNESPVNFVAFMIVVLVTNAVLLGLWRGAFAIVSARRGE